MNATAHAAAISDNLAYWIPSACVQAFAALTALTGIFGVFKLQQVSELQTRMNAQFCGLLDEITKVGSSKHASLVAAHTPQSLHEIDLREGIERWSFDLYFKPWLQVLRRDGPDVESKKWAAMMLMQAHMPLVALKALSNEHDRCLRAALVPVIANGVAVIVSLLVLTTLDWIGGVTRTGLLLFLILYGVTCVVITLVYSYVILVKPGAVGSRVVSVPDPFVNLRVE